MAESIPRNAPIYISGHRGMVGSALVRRFEQAGFERILTATRQELDLRDQRAVDEWFDVHRPQYVVHVAGTVGGIGANAARPADFLYDNLMMHATVLRAAWRTDVAKLLYLGSSCIYPRDCPQPMREEDLLTGPLEPSNEAYAIAKLSGVKACQAYRRQHGRRFIAALPTNLYGPGDHFDLNDSHVVAALIRKFHDARKFREVRDSTEPTVTLWGTGSPRREFLYVDDLADACLLLLERYDEAAPINVGVGVDLTIAELADEVRKVVCPRAQLQYDTSKPDGTPRKLLDVSRLQRLGWRPRTTLPVGLEETYRWFQEHVQAT